MIGTSLLTDGDMYSAAIRYSDLKEFDNFAVDCSTRYPVIQDFRVQLHIVGAYSVGKTGGLERVHGHPFAALQLLCAQGLEFLEVEVGDRMTWRSQGTT